MTFGDIKPYCHFIVDGVKWIKIPLSAGANATKRGGGVSTSFFEDSQQVERETTGVYFKDVENYEDFLVDGVRWIKIPYCGGGNSEERNAMIGFQKPRNVNGFWVYKIVDKFIVLFKDDQEVVR